MRRSDEVFPVDFKEKRNAKGLTQEKLADKWGVARETIARIENGKQSISFPLALRGASEFGSLTLRAGSRTFTIWREGSPGPSNGKPHDDIPNTEEHENLNGVEHFVHAYNKIEEGRAELRAALADPRTWRYDADEGRAGRIGVVKKLIDIREAADGALQEIHTDDFEVYQEGARLHLAERGLLEEGEGVEPAA